MTALDALLALAHVLGTLAATTAAAVVIEQLLALALRSALLRRDPLVSAVDQTVSYHRSLAALTAPDVRRTWRGLLGAGGLAACGLLLSPLCFLPALGLLGLALKNDIETWECVAISPWQVAWRRGWQRSIRRLPLVQVARVHLVERALPPEHGWFARRWGRELGSCYLALELHSGRAVKLPRTSLLADRELVEHAARFLRRRLREAERERRQALRDHQRATRRARRLLPDARERSLQRELAALRRSHPREVYRIGHWPGQSLELLPDTAPDALLPSAPGELSAPIHPARHTPRQLPRAHG
ncbi:MAG TPA: hypothetical protein PLW24_25730 [Burkholderiaceae bacterium]|nr:hypothetical protein [Burkholderiaceae bacterium]HNG82895.1 hypothetical protein [Burkholderiaceae bacterium]